MTRVMLLKYLAALVSLAGGYFALAAYHQDVGYDKAVTEISRDSADKISVATGEAIHAAELEIAKALARSRKIFDDELQRAKDERIVEIEVREVINDVEKIVYTNNCGNLNGDSIKLLNQTIDKVNSSAEN